MKFYIYLGITIGGIVGGWIGSMLDNGNAFGAWGIILSTVGGIAGLYVGYKMGQELGS